MQCGTIDKNYSIPLYQQIAEDIKRQIKEKRLMEGAKLPGETELSQLYSVSRVTVRKAFALLTENGYIISQQGRGTFVAQQKLERTYVPKVLMGFSENCERQGMTPSAEILSIDIVPTPGWMLDRLPAVVGERSIRIRRLLFADSHPVMLDEVFCALSFSDLLQLDLTKSLFSHLRNMGFYPSECVRELDIFSATAEEAQHLGVQEGEPLLAIKDIIYDQNNTLLTCGKEIINPKRYRIQMEL